MKKLFLLVIVLALVFSLCALPVFAEGEPATEENAENIAQDSIKVPTTDENEIYEQILGIVTNGEIWAKIGVSVVGIFSLVIAVRSTVNKFTVGIGAIKDMIAGKATKEETAAVIKDGLNEVNKKYDATYTELSRKYKELEESNSKMMAVLSLVTLQLVKSPNARTEIMGLILNHKEIGGDVAELVTDINKAISDADAEIPKPETPAIDEIVSNLAPKENEETSEIMLLG